MKRFTQAALAAAIACAIAAPAFAQEKVTVWFTKGFYKAEDDALYEVIKKYEAKNPGVKIDLSLYGTEDCNTKSVGAVDSVSNLRQSNNRYYGLRWWRELMQR